MMSSNLHLKIKISDKHGLQIVQSKLGLHYNLKRANPILTIVATR